MTEFDTLIKGGTVIDGTGAPRRNADIAICPQCSSQWRAGGGRQVRDERPRQARGAAAQRPSRRRRARILGPVEVAGCRGGTRPGERHRVELPGFGEKARARRTNLLEFSTPYNPLDLAGQANDPAWLASTMNAAFQEPGFGTVVLLSTASCGDELRFA
jgi:hypothetical protein